MPKLLATTLLSVSLFAGAVAADGVVDAGFPAAEQVRELFGEGVKEYRAGRLDKAAASFREALKLNPENKQAYEFYLATGDALLLRMSEYGQLGEVLKDVLRKARIYQKSLRSSPEYIELLIAKLASSDEERLVATNELAAVGPQAVPFLVAKLADNRQDDLRVHVRLALSRMGYRAVIPLTVALASQDERLVTSVIASLADIGDARALPWIARVAEDAKTAETLKRVAANAVAAIAARNQSEGPQAADQLFFQAALRYFRASDLARDEMSANEGLIWMWDDKVEDATKRLSAVRVPRYAWCDLMAENLLFAGLANYPNFPSYHPLLAAVYAAQDVSAQRRGRLAKESTVPAVDPEEAQDVIAARVQVLGEMNLRVRMFGAANLYRAVQLALASDRPEVASYLMRLLEDRGLANAEANLPVATLLDKNDKDKSDKDKDKDAANALGKPGAVLVAALDSPDKLVRYQAAITLAKLDPSLRFFNADKVIPALNDAIGEWGMRTILVVDQDFRQRNVAREQLQALGYRVYAAPNGFEALQRLQETPVKDAVIVAGDLVPYLRDSSGALIEVPQQKSLGLVEQIRKDWRSEKTPILISVPEDAGIAGTIQALFEGKVNGFVHKPFASQEMQDQLQAAVASSPLANTTREDIEDISLRAAQALAAIDVHHSQFDITSAAQALVQTLPARADTMRIAALHALGNAAKGANGEVVRKLIDKVTDAYGAGDAQMSVELRVAFLYAIGQMNPTTESAVAIVGQALKHDDAAVRAAAAQAVGHAPALEPAVLYRLQAQQRLDLHKQALSVAPAPAATP